MTPDQLKSENAQLKMTLEQAQLELGALAMDGVSLKAQLKSQVAYAQHLEKEKQRLEEEVKALTPAETASAN